MEKSTYLAPYQKTPRMIDLLFQSILSGAQRRPKTMTDSDTEFQTLYSSVKKILVDQDSIFMVGTVIAALEQAKIKHTHQEVLETLHILEDVGKVRKMGEVQVGEVSHNLYLYGES